MEASDALVTAIERQNELLEALLTHIIGPEYLEAKLGSAEEDKIDDGVGTYDTTQQAKDDLHKLWVEKGYPDEIVKHLR